MTQNEMVLDYLKAGKTLTPMAAQQLFGVGRLAARINDLRRKGYPIVTKKKKGRPWAIYTMEASNAG